MFFLFLIVYPQKMTFLIVNFKKQLYLRKKRDFRTYAEISIIYVIVKLVKILIC